MHWLTIYKKGTFPANGWIQQCFMCYRATSHTVEYNKDEYIHTVYLCKCCQKKNRSEDNKKIYVQNVEQYIEEHTPQPFAVPKISLSPPKIISILPQQDLPRPHSIHMKSPYTLPPPLPPKKLPPLPITQPAPVAPVAPAPASAAPVAPASAAPVAPASAAPAAPKSLYVNLLEQASKKISSYINKFTT